jgi:UDP-2-acetamido-2-deoxy-ribo-hexuluronate aminotransferase
MTPTLVSSQVRSIPFFDYRHLFLSEEQELIAIFQDVGRRGAFILQEDLTRFERNLAAYLGVKYVLGVGNATDALLLALRAAGIGSGDEVIFCSHTMVATAAAIHFAGATPVPVECSEDHLIDPEAVERAVTPRTRAILPTQLNGRTADMQALKGIANRHGLVIVEDAAQALGSRFQGRMAGTFGAAGVISFFPAKMLGCLGDGGAILTNSEHIYERVVELRDHGRGADGEIVSWGLNSRLDNLQAAILDFRLASYDAAIEQRRALAGFYRDRLQGIRQLKLPPGPDLREHESEHFDVFQNYEIEAERRDELRAFLKTHQIGTALPWGGKAVHQWPRLGFEVRLPFTEALFERILLLPLNLSLTHQDVDHICNTIIDFYD